MRRKGTPIGQYGSDLDFGVPRCKFYITKVMYLGLIISRNRIKIDFKKVAAIINWESPINI